MSSISPLEQASYTYDDYKRFPDSLRCEIIDGRVFDMTPAPSIKHQQVVGELYRQIKNHLIQTGNHCRVHIAPTDVVLAQNHIVQPDVLIVCDHTRIREAAVFGPPDAVFEVLSLGTEAKDRSIKMDLYERYGIAEYFLVHPEAEYVEKHLLVDGAYGRPRLHRGEDIFSIDGIGLELRAGDIFAG